ncbi:cell division protein FtsH [Neisseria gonorrhoeae]|uniref:Cell division protein FtsH n=1 Tax=Neisseria gonorrhoeae TaxID=485 RepID=A0A378VZG6_NEIGO|nr:cell division protein FtsH [Neisseria gonorrhoeae]
METMCKALMEWETIDRDQVLEIMAGKQPSPPKDYSHNLRENADAAEDNAPHAPTREKPKHLPGRHRLDRVRAAA